MDRLGSPSRTAGSNDGRNARVPEAAGPNVHGDMARLAQGYAVADIESKVYVPSPCLDVVGMQRAGAAPALDAAVAVTLEHGTPPCLVGSASATARPSRAKALVPTRHVAVDPIIWAVALPGNVDQIAASVARDPSPGAPSDASARLRAVEHFAPVRSPRRGRSRLPADAAGNHRRDAFRAAPAVIETGARAVTLTRIVSLMRPDGEDNAAIAAGLLFGWPPNRRPLSSSGSTKACARAESLRWLVGGQVSAAGFTGTLSGTLGKHRDLPLARNRGATPRAVSSSDGASLCPQIIPGVAA